MNLEAKSDEELRALISEASAILEARQPKTKLERRQEKMKARNRGVLSSKQEPVSQPVAIKSERIYSVMEIHGMWPGRSPDTLRRMFRNVEGVEVYKGVEATKEDGTQTRPYTSLGIPESVYLRYRRDHAN